jgi:hypothetical protein
VALSAIDVTRYMKPHLTGKKSDVQNILFTGSNCIPKPSEIFSMLDVVPFFQLIHSSCRDAGANASLALYMCCHM